MERKELELEKRCRQYARERGWVACKLEKNGHKGIPDDLFISPDGESVLLVEFKKDEHQKPRPEQLHWLQKYAKIMKICGDFDDFTAILEAKSGHF